MSDPTTLHHGWIKLALHPLRAGTGRPLLLLHGLGEASPTEAPAVLADWTGPIWALDFTGHGGSGVPVGGGYTAELLVADVDHALAHLGEATILGRGLGAYVALLVAGARPELVTGAILADGPGIEGGGPSPHSPRVDAPLTTQRDGATPDPAAMVELSADVRPPDYALVYTRQALEYAGLDTPIFVVASARPPWLAAVADEAGIVVADLPTALGAAADLRR